MSEDLHNIMVDISCPHCGEDIEIEDGDYETHTCPVCDGDFEYREDGIYIKVDSKVLIEESRTLEKTNQQNKISSLIIIDGYMGQKEEIQKKQNIVSGLFTIGLTIAISSMILIFNSGNEFENFYDTENFGSLFVISMVGWGLCFVAFLFSNYYNERIKAVNRKIKSEREYL